MVLHLLISYHLPTFFDRDLDLAMAETCIRIVIEKDESDSILVGDKLAALQENIDAGMIFIFYRSMGYDVGKSLVEEDMIELAGELMKKAEAKGVKLVLPTDVVLADKFDENANAAVAPADSISGDWLGLDIGPDSLEAFAAEIAAANTIVWNGPMGVFEMPQFAVGTVQVAELLAEATARGATTIIGGGDSVAAVNQAGLGDKVSHISTGGGASLELLEGKELPGVAALTEV